MNSAFKLRITNYELRIVRFLCVLCVLCGSIFSVRAQSINQSNPTPIIANEITGRIAARDLGDARLTTYFYTFDGTQGDVFINVVTSNFNGDIDVFTADNLRPLTKISIYADASANETGRVVYLRQPTRMILRVEGRTPNDDAATYRIKFAGSFAPSQAVAENTDAETPSVKSDNQTDVRVNSVGTIVEIKPKPTPKEIIAEKTEAKTETIAKLKKQPKKKAIIRDETSEAKSEEKETKTEASVTEQQQEQNTAEKNEAEEAAQAQTETKPSVVAADETAKIENAETNEKAENKTPEKTDANEEKPVAKAETKIVEKSPEKKKSNAPKPLPPSALENIRLVILFKDGSKIERPMSEVLKFGVEKGVLTVIAKDGAIGRYSILDVEKMTIE